MTYIQRDAQNNIIGKYACKQEGYAEEFLSDDAIPSPTPVQLRLLAIAAMHPLSPDEFRIELNKLGVLDKFEAAIATCSRDVHIKWEFASEWPRDDELLNDKAKFLGLTDEQVDGMFT